jgi:hypothetical protein
MTGMDAVILAAAKISFSARERRELWSTNIEGTANVVNAALERKIRRFLYVSSVAALGRTASSEEVTEEKSWEKSPYNTNYAISKFHGEMEVWRGMGEGLPAVIVNPSTILGYGDWNNTSCAIFRSVFNEFPWYTEGINGFVDVLDTARAIVRLLGTDIHGKGIREETAYPRSHPPPDRGRLARGESQIPHYRPQDAAYPRERTGRCQFDILQQRQIPSAIARFPLHAAGRNHPHSLPALSAHCASLKFPNSTQVG